MLKYIPPVRPDGVGTPAGMTGLGVRINRDLRGGLFGDRAVSEYLNCKLQLQDAN